MEENMLEKDVNKSEKTRKDINKNISDPEILEAIMASLKEAEDALENPDVKEKLDLGGDLLEETVEITKMEPQAVNNEIGLECRSDQFKPMEDEEFKDVDNDVTESKVLKPATRKRKKPAGRGWASTPVPLKRVSGRRGRSRVAVDMSEFSEEEKESELVECDSDYNPVKCSSKVTPTKRKSMLKKVSQDDVLFGCSHCTFHSDILGELKIHSHSNHEDCAAPTYLDMAEAAVAKLDDSAGVEEMTVLKEILFDHFDLIVEDKSCAAQLLSQALRVGVKLGRLQISRKGRGKDKFKVVTKEKMMLVMQKWRVSNESMEMKPSHKKRTCNLRNKVTIIGGGKTKVTLLTPRPTKGDDSDVVVLDESLTPQARPRAMSKKVSAVKSKAEVNPADHSLSQNIIPQSQCSSDSDEEESDTLVTCPLCQASFWYEHQTFQHMRRKHPDYLAYKLDTADDKMDNEVLDGNMELLDLSNDIVHVDAEKANLPVIDEVSYNPNCNKDDCKIVVGLQEEDGDDDIKPEVRVVQEEDEEEVKPKLDPNGNIQEQYPDQTSEELL